MSIRGPKSIKLYHNGELCAEMESVKATIDLLVLHDPMHRSWNRVRDLFLKARKNNTALFGFTFLEDSNWIPSRAVSATDVETGETFVKESVSEMAKVIFGPSKHSGLARISDLCKNDRTHRGLTFRYVDDAFPSGYGNMGSDDRKPVQQLDIVTGVVNNEFSSITKAAYYIWDEGISSATCVINIRASLSDCVNGNPKYNGKYLGYRWQFSNPQDRPNNN